MSKNWTYHDALRAIWQRSAYDRGFVSNPFAGDTAANLGLRRTAELLRRFDQPHQQYGIIHVTGSKGKGSTCAFIAAILRAAGYRTGLYTSPHLHTYRERIAINGEPIDETQFTALTRRALDATEALERERPDLGEVTAFEMTTAMALWHFATMRCDIGVIEVGMGGTLDATNVVSPLVSVITALDLEHTRVLGHTIAEIAANKAGIIKPGRPVVVTPQTLEAEQVITERATAVNSRMLLGGRDWHTHGSWDAMTARGPWGEYEHLQLSLPGIHQVENAGAAIAATWLVHDDDFLVPGSAVKTGLRQTSWPGRIEIIDRPNEPLIIIDGAHTPASARVLTATIASMRPNSRAIIILAMLADKNPLALLQALTPIARHIIITTTRSPRSLAPAEIANATEHVGLSYEIVADMPTALNRGRALANASDLIVVTGSLTTVAEAREILGLASPDPLIAL